MASSSSSFPQQPKLPSALPSRPALHDDETTKEELEGARIGRATKPSETAIFVCAFADCYRLYPSKERVMMHRKRDHDTEDEGRIITWNE